MMKSYVENDDIGIQYCVPFSIHLVAWHSSWFVLSFAKRKAL